MGKIVEIRLVRISKSQHHCNKCCRKCKISNDEFPKLVSHLRDDCGDFFIAPGGRFWHPEYFFSTYPQHITKFQVLIEELNKEMGEDCPTYDVLSNPPEPGNLFPRTQ